MAAFRIRHGEFHDVSGPIRRRGDITFVPARVSLGGTSFDFTHHLDTYAAGAPLETRALVKPGDDAPWVLGRLMFLFGAQPTAEESRPEKSCVCEAFLAVLHSSDNLSVPFVCTDYYCRTALMFSSDDPPDDSVRATIADGFWSLLLSSPADVVDYESRMFHPGICRWIEFGVAYGEPYSIEAEDD